MDRSDSCHTPEEYLSLLVALIRFEPKFIVAARLVELEAICETPESVSTHSAGVG